MSDTSTLQGVNTASLVPTGSVIYKVTLADGTVQFIELTGEPTADESSYLARVGAVPSSAEALASAVRSPTTGVQTAGFVDSQGFQAVIDNIKQNEEMQSQVATAIANSRDDIEAQRALQIRQSQLQKESLALNAQKDALARSSLGLNVKKDALSQAAIRENQQYSSGPSAISAESAGITGGQGALLDQIKANDLSRVNQGFDLQNKANDLASSNLDIQDKARAITAANLGIQDQASLNSYNQSVRDLALKQNAADKANQASIIKALKGV